LRHNCEFYLPFLYIKNSIGRITLSKDRLLLGESLDLSTAVNGRKKGLGIEFLAFLDCRRGCHDLAPLKLKVAQETRSSEERILFQVRFRQRQYSFVF
jgi:hypothetical protein